MKIYSCFSIFVISLLSVFLSLPTTASEIKFAYVTLTLLSDSEKIMDTQLVVEIGKTATLEMNKKNAAGIATAYRADFEVENTTVNESGNAVAFSSLRVSKFDNDKKRWVTEREQKFGLRLNGSTAKISMHSPEKGAPQSETLVSISPLTEAEVHAKYGRASVKNALTLKQ